VSSFSARLADATRSLGDAGISIARGGWLTARRGVAGAALGTRGLVARRRGAGAMLGVGIARLLVQLPADAFILLVARVLSGLQTALGLEPLARALDDDERALMTRVFGDGIDVRRVRLKPGRHLLHLPRLAFVIGNTVHLPARSRRGADGKQAPAGSFARRAPALLVHELTHVWQHQHHGTRYLSECLLAQWVGEGYNVAVALEASRGWEQLNFEQQAELLGRAYAARWFDGDGDASDGRRLLLRLSDPKSDDGFDVAVVPPAEAEELLAGGWRDATPLLREGLAAVRAPLRR
jgi:hypothetical protein